MRTPAYWLLLCAASAGAMYGQDAAAPAAPAPPPAAATNPAPVEAQTPAASPAPAPAAAAASPVPSNQEILSGSLDLGYRFIPNVGGSFATYRSIVDYTPGPKLLGTDFTILDPGWHLFDRIDVQASDWGNDPYSTFHIDIRKKKLYNFTGDYRSLAYYSNVPSFADPLLANGVVLNEQALDTRNRIGSWDLELLPDHTIMPYLDYERDSSSGIGVSNFVANSNEYPVNNLTNNLTDNYRAGVRIERQRLHVKLEQGGTVFRDAQQLNTGGNVSAAQPNFGNFFAPVFGQTLDLTSLAEAYGVRGHSIYTDGSFSANPVSWADIYGTFLYSEPVSNVNFLGLDTGNQILLSQILFYTGEQNLIYSEAKQPHTSANLGAEIRPLPKVRLIPSWLTDRMHTTGSSNGQQTLTLASTTSAVTPTAAPGQLPLASYLTSGLVSNYNQAGMNVFVDVTSKITVRGGYNYVWGYANDGVLPFGGLIGFEQGKIRRNVAIAGLSWHPLQNAWINIDFEDGTSGSTYFATSLYNYQKARIRGRHQITPSFSVSASATVLNNRNPSPGVNYDFLSHQESASILYSPSGGKNWDFEGSYTRSTLYSNIAYLDPEFLIPELSLYRDNSHTVTALFDLNMPGKLRGKGKLSVGGSAYLSSGSNPTRFYQPTAKLSMLLHRNISWISEWRYYGFAESFYMYQGFRTNLISTGLRFTR